MKSYRNISFWLIISVLILTAINMCNNLFLDIKSNEEYGLYTAKTSDKIEITKNSDWIVLKDDGICTGSGSTLDPYIIQNFIINGDGTSNCISIENSNVVFIIKNCTLINSGSQTTNAGIYFENVQNGKIMNNNCTTNENGIYLFSSSSIEIKNNYVSNNERIGIRLEQSNNNLISGNTVKDNPYGGIRIVDSSCTISDNTVHNNDYFEIFVFYSDHSIISENDADEITIYNSDYSIISENEVNDNHGIVLSCSNYSEISDNILGHNHLDGIRIWGSKNNEISGNLFNGNSRGITLCNSKKNTITENTFINNIYGIYIENSKENQLTSNIFNYNDIGIYLDSNSICNEASDNEFTGNDVNIQDNQGLCFSEIPILQIVVISITSIILIGGIIFGLRRKSRRSKITMLKEPITPLSEKEPISREKLIETPVTMEVEQEELNELILQEEQPPLQVKSQLDLELTEEDLVVSDKLNMQEQEKERLVEEFNEKLSIEEPTLEEIISPSTTQEPTPEIIKEEILTEEETKQEIITPPATEDVWPEAKKEPLSIKEKTTEPVPVPITHEIICKYCGFSNEEDASFCKQCGQVIKKRK